MEELGDTGLPVNLSMRSLDYLKVSLLHINKRKKLLVLKGTVSVILSGFLCKETISDLPWKPLLVTE